MAWLDEVVCEEFIDNVKSVGEERVVLVFTVLGGIGGLENKLGVEFLSVVWIIGKAVGIFGSGTVFLFPDSMRKDGRVGISMNSKWVDR